MKEIETFELERWSEPDEKHQVKHIGMADAQETFDKLNAHLEKLKMLPDEYFLFSGERTGLKELHNFNEAICHVNFGGSEGIYLDISLTGQNKQGEPTSIRFATGKTLDDDADAFYHMSRIAAECSLMLNGRGNSFERKNVELNMTMDEALIVGSVLEHELCGYVEPETEKVLSFVLEQIISAEGSLNKAEFIPSCEDEEEWER